MAPDIPPFHEKNLAQWSHFVEKQFALRQDAGLADGLNTWLGKLTCRGVAESQQRSWTAAAGVIG